MATTLHLNFGDIVFSSAVGRITVRSDASAVDISLHILSSTRENLVFSETYYPYSGTVALHDFASVIEAEMAQWAQPLATFRLTAKAIRTPSTIPSTDGPRDTSYHGIDNAPQRRPHRHFLLEKVGGNRASA